MIALRSHREDEVETTEPEDLRPLYVEWKQTGTCFECQADGVACDRPDGDCELCGRSTLP
jgi:hypothetical protein